MLDPYRDDPDEVESEGDRNVVGASLMNKSFSSQGGVDQHDQEEQAYTQA